MKKILILSANPKNTANLRLDEEVREIKNTLAISPHRDEFQIITESAVRVDDLTRFLSYHQPTIVHFSGHGSGTDGLVLEDNSGNVQLVSTQALAKLFDLFQQQVECVLLNACYSEAQADSIHQYIDCVVGMNQAIGDQAAIKFSVGFYTAFGAGMNYEDCFQMGCTSIDLQGIPEYATPEIKIRRRRYQTEQAINPVKSDNINSSNNNKDKEDSSVSVGGRVKDSVIIIGDRKVGQNRSVSVGNNVTGGAIITGDNNTASINFQPVSLPAPATVNIEAEINALREILAKLETSDRRKIDNAFEDAQEELNKPQPDKDEVGDALNRALKYAKKAEGFASAIGRLQPHLTKITAWLGADWHDLLNLVNLTSCSKIDCS
ncbi:CHAT domain-containing protein [Calothrix sp. FACHB-1219]|uniref:CHAT domain-containing protein n=1 Tax=unclassified Calothrix TaxID=2619626 RepID=UPI0016831481|nr:CHAT domain-containing protein [Calothrix sp. FACHB-168]MBD2206246.1 CHAT domain-containing protein [Calothrix sp. FACHB-168]MBD2219142.1 CHAT domain-containing protein [Calothrix sp. FACHB-1219]